MHLITCTVSRGGEPLADTLVYAYNVEAFSGSAITNADGEALFLFPPGVYTLTIWSTEVGATSVEVTVVADPVSVALDEPEYVPDLVPQPGCCVVYGRFTNAEGAPMQNVRLSFATLAPRVLPGVIGPAAIHASDAQGRIALNLLSGLKVRATLLGTSQFREFVVPSQPRAPLSTLWSLGVPPYQLS